ncbi:MAG: DNA-binding protein [Oscillospiraceae bacterium]|nr:DNA-binding protein [Oscillospiraceae bacterium]
MMTRKTKQELIAEIVTLLEKRIEVEDEKSAPVITVTQNQPLEMLTVKECTQAVSGLSEHTVRQLVRQSKVAFIRTGQGERGKILVSKKALLEYLGGKTA